MKILRLLIIALFTMSAWAHAAVNQNLSLQDQENVRQMTQEMSALGISEVKVQKMFTFMYHNRFQQQNILRAQQILMNAVKEGVPAEPIMNKAMEGMVKQAQEKQVIKAMEAVRSRHEYANRMAKSLSSNKNTAKIMAGAIADSLTAGMRFEEMGLIATQLTIQSRQQTRNQTEALSLQTMQTVRTMARLGAMSKDVSDTVCLALQHKYTSRQMEQLRHNFSRDAQQASARQLARQYAGTIDKGGNPGNSDGRDSSNGGGSDNGGSSGSGHGSDGGSGGGAGSDGGSGGGAGSDGGSGGGAGGGGGGGGGGGK